MSSSSSNRNTMDSSSSSSQLTSSHKGQLKRTYARFFSDDDRSAAKHEKKEDPLSLLEKSINNPRTNLNELYVKIKEWQKYHESQLDRTIDMITRINDIWDWEEAKNSGCLLVVHEHDDETNSRMIEAPMTSVTLMIPFLLSFDRKYGVKVSTKMNECDRTDALSVVIESEYQLESEGDNDDAKTVQSNFYLVKDQPFIEAQCRKHLLVNPNVENYEIKCSVMVRYLVYKPYKEQNTPNPSPLK